MQEKSWKKVSTQRGSPELRKLLNAWVAVIERYTSSFDDNPWWYNERAILSTLAGAAWTLDGWVALEEFTTVKRLRTLEPGVDHGDKLRNGRCDLYVRAPKISFAFEAKQATQSIGRRSDGASYTLQARKAAWDDIGDVQAHEADCRFAATFVVPTIPLSEIFPPGGKLGEICTDKVVSLIKAWLEDVLGCIGPLSKYRDFAFIFPSLGTAEYFSNGRYYPGVVLVLEERLRATRRFAT
ncbi:hypothetical protein HBO25_20000 [Pseudomonas nitroreducens]|nr:hypothetical protein [Pseudomonas nitroreducens]SNT46996.1 hypothetical protein SAMN05216209_5464 [Pseudomonas nitroreducens]